MSMAPSQTATSPRERSRPLAQPRPPTTTNETISAPSSAQSVLQEHNLARSQQMPTAIRYPQPETQPTFGCAGMFLEQPTGAAQPIYLTMNRAYDPYSGRWLSRDPAGEDGGINLYGYADQNPVDKFDPDDLQVEIFEPENYDPAPFVPSDPYSPESTSSRQSQTRNPAGPGPIANVGVGILILGFPLRVGLSMTGAGDAYIDIGVSTPGPSGSLVYAPSMNGYAYGPSFQGGDNGAQVGSTPGMNEPSKGGGIPGASASYGFPLGNVCDAQNAETNQETNDESGGTDPYGPQFKRFSRT
jgi:RHS repeat-associated protein